MSDEQYAFLENEAPDEPAEVAEVAAPETVVTPEAPAPVAPTAAEPLEATHVPLAALKAEREKRQAYERELQALRQQQAQHQQQAPEPNFYEAPEQYVQQALQGERQQMTQALHMALEADAREAFADYDEVLAEVGAAAQDNPAIRSQVFNSPNPAKAAYKLGKQMREMKAMQDPAAYRATLAAEIRAEIAAESQAKETARANAAAAIPPDLSAARSARDQEVIPDDSLDSILASKKRR